MLARARPLPYHARAPPPYHARAAPALSCVRAAPRYHARIMRARALSMIYYVLSHRYRFIVYYLMG